MKHGELTSGTCTAALAIAITVTVTLTTACSGQAGHADPEPGIDAASHTITIGSTAPKTGPEDAFYESSLAAQAMVKEVNAHGGVNGWKLRYRVLDDQYEPALAVQGVQQLISQDNVFALVSMFGTPSNAATIPFAVSQNVPDVGFAMEAGIIARKYPHANNLFGYIPPYSELAAFVVRYAATSARYQSVALAYQDDDSGASALTGFRYEAGHDGLPSPVTVAVSDSATDFTGYAARLAAAKAQAVLLWLPPAQAAGVMRACAAIGYHPHWIGSFFDAVPALFQAVGAQANGMQFESWLVPLDDQAPAMRSALDSMRAYGGLRDPSINAELGWLGMGIFIAGLERATAHGATPTRASLMSALNDGAPINPGGLPVAIRYTSNSRVPAVPDTMLTYTGTVLRRSYGPAPDAPLPAGAVR